MRVAQRRPFLLVTVVLLLVSACGVKPDGGTVGEDGTAGSTPGGEETRPTDPTAPSGDDDHLPGAATTGPQVPELLQEIDDLAETVVTITTTAGEGVRVDAKVAGTTEEQRRGLMQVPALPSGVGMLFVFPEPRTGGFWMFNTLVPLDIAYIDEDGAIATILAMDPCRSDDPGDCPVYTPDGPYEAALEVPQGWFADAGVRSGDIVTWTDPVPAG